jgi:hypothetical protein
VYKPEPTDPGLNFKGLSRSGCRYLNVDLYPCYALYSELVVPHKQAIFD